eukprot:TRINITY_DN5107_c0_g2_i4.p3 TRINITY_DN5107_c0_g2~~TRINITY_DN5107_c0_g2_i4.p3  ORF type:complete len:118 (+),score=11.17 TRINITY_DN5107_c0_g2_i4:249-602(+)
MQEVLCGWMIQALDKLYLRFLKFLGDCKKILLNRFLLGGSYQFYQVYFCSYAFARQLVEADNKKDMSYGEKAQAFKIVGQMIKRLVILYGVDLLVSYVFPRQLDTEGWGFCFCFGFF